MVILQYQRYLLPDGNPFAESGSCHWLPFGCGKATFGRLVLFKSLLRGYALLYWLLVLSWHSRPKYKQQSEQLI